MCPENEFEFLAAFVLTVITLALIGALSGISAEEVDNTVVRKILRNVCKVGFTGSFGFVFMALGYVWYVLLIK